MDRERDRDRGRERFLVDFLFAILLWSHFLLMYYIEYVSSMILQTFFLVSLIGYLVLYLSGRKYAETFQDQSARTVAPPEKPYNKEPIDSLDQYELSAVYQQQGSKEATKQQLDQAMTRYPMDWSVQGQGSQYYQENEEKYRGSAEALRANEVTGQRASDPTDMMLPDTAQQEAEERKILQTYKPEKSANLLNYSVDDVKTLVEKLYSKRGLIPELVPSKQGQNVWEITEVREKNPKIVWEDDPSALAQMGERDKMIARGEETIDGPYTVSDLAAGLDPFFQKGSSARDGRFNYNQWTPGLERMFAPTHPVKQWM